MLISVQHFIHGAGFVAVLFLSLFTLLRKRNLLDTHCEDDHHGFLFTCAAVAANLIAILCSSFSVTYLPSSSAANPFIGEGISFRNWHPPKDSNFLCKLAFGASLLWMFVVTTGVGAWGIATMASLGRDCLFVYDEGKFCDFDGDDLVAFLCASTSVFGLMVIHTCFSFVPFGCAVLILLVRWMKWCCCGGGGRYHHRSSSLDMYTTVDT